MYLWDRLVGGNVLDHICLSVCEDDNWNSFEWILMKSGKFYITDQRKVD